MVAERSRSDMVLSPLYFALTLPKTAIVHWLLVIVNRTDTNSTNDWSEGKGQRLGAGCCRASFRTDVRNPVMRRAREISQSMQSISFRNDKTCYLVKKSFALTPPKTTIVHWLLLIVH